MKRVLLTFSFFGVVILSFGMSHLARAEGESPESAKSQKVKEIEKKYWGDRSQDSRVIQDRVYRKKNHVEFGAFGSFVSTDPFLSVLNAGVSLGFHFTEHVSVHALGWRYFASKSSALLKLENSSAASTARTNRPEQLLGGELRLSVIYGKLSLFGKSILQYDLYFDGGAGMLDSQTGSYFTAMIGAGQQTHLSKWFGIKIDYRLTRYVEKIVDYRQNLSDVFSLGVSVFL